MLRPPGIAATTALCGAALLATNCGDRSICPVCPVLPSDGGMTPETIGPVVCKYDLLGFAAVNGTTTGGAGGPTMVVSTEAALKTAAGTDGPMIIRIQGSIALTGQVEVFSDKTLEGVDVSSQLTGAGFLIKNVHNVIVRNLTISKALPPGDAIAIQTAQHVWVDHCDLSSENPTTPGMYDDLVSVTHASDYVTVSWTVFHDHDQVALVGHSDSTTAMTEDVGHLTATFHHNLFTNTNSHGPSLRFGTLHAYNNYYLGVVGAIESRMGGQVLAEHNYFNSVNMAMTTVSSSPTPGFLTNNDNVLLDSNINVTQAATWQPSSVPGYVYSADLPTAQVPMIVTDCAGPGHSP